MPGQLAEAEPFQVLLQVRNFQELMKL